MLLNFFRLNSPFTTLATQQDLMVLQQGTDVLDSFLYQPNELRSVNSVHPTIKFHNKTFKNFSFSKTLIANVNFFDCVFEDCLFIGTSFEDCEFHGCRFQNCNLWKIRLNSTYLDPLALKGNFTDRKFANIASDAFQELYKNAKNEHMVRHAENADFNFRKWTRWYLIHKLKKKEITGAQFLGRYVLSWLYQWLLGYGYRLPNLVFTAIGIFAVFCFINYKNWYCFSIVPQDNVYFTKTFLNTLYLTFRNMTAFDFAGFYPAKDIGKYLLIIEGVFGYFILGCLISLLFKKISR